MQIGFVSQQWCAYTSAARDNNGFMFKTLLLLCVMCCFTESSVRYLVCRVSVKKYCRFTNCFIFFCTCSAMFIFESLNSRFPFGFIFIVSRQGFHDWLHHASNEKHVSKSDASSRNKRNFTILESCLSFVNKDLFSVIFKNILFCKFMQDLQS